MTQGSSPDKEIAASSPRWDVLVLPDVIDAEDEVRAREVFVQALIDEPGLIRVTPHYDDIDIKEGDDAIGRTLGI